MNTFSESILREIVANISNTMGKDNYDEYRYGPYNDARNNQGSLLKRFIKKKLNSFNYYNRNLLENEFVGPLKKLKFHFANVYEKNAHHFEYLYNVLEDDNSRNLLIKVLAFRLMGYTKIKLPLNTPEYWKSLKDTDNLVEGTDEIDLDFLHFKLKKYNLNKLGFPIVAYLNALGVVIDFIIEQYKYRHNATIIEVEEGDTVIDAGACYGDTALYFASKAGNTGKVYSLEFIPKNIEIFERNRSLNPLLKENITLIKHPLWDASGIPVNYKEFGPGSRISIDPEGNSGTAETITIDEMVRKYKIEKVDFIKMDIEGAELKALHGAIETIKKFTPKLSVCLYHSPEDFGTIPQFINELNLGYKFYLGHSTIHAEETVLFASAK